MKFKELHFADVAEILGAVTEELKEVEKRGIFDSFSGMYDLTKVCS